MHTHQVLIPAWRWRQERAPVEPFLRRGTAEELVIATSGGSDWLTGSGRADKVEGGYRVSGRKIFASGSPAGDIFTTLAIYDDPADGPTVMHFAIPLDAPGVKRHDNWRTLGMRGTGSHDLTLDGVFVPDAVISARRPSGRWSHLWHIVAATALPVIYSVYVGVAEAARDVALARPAPSRRSHRPGDSRRHGHGASGGSDGLVALGQMTPQRSRRKLGAVTVRFSTKGT
jgi:Acyl-CoA dehydrogenases